MTLGNIVGLVYAADRVLKSLRRADPDQLLARLADIADDEPALKKLFNDIEQLNRNINLIRRIPVEVRATRGGDTHEPMGPEGVEEVYEVRDDEAGVVATGRAMRRR